MNETPTVSRIFVCSIFGLSVIALGFARDNTTTTPTPTPTPDMAVAPADYGDAGAGDLDDRPAMGSTAGGTSVTITGSGFQQGATVKISVASPSRARRCRRTVRRDHIYGTGQLGQARPCSDVIVTNPNATRRRRRLALPISSPSRSPQEPPSRKAEIVARGTFCRLISTGDNILDLAVAYANSSSTVVTYKGTSAGATISFGTRNPAASTPIRSWFRRRMSREAGTST